jgi:hypothetical protein
LTELSAYEFSALRDGAFTLSRGLGNGIAPILLVAPAGDYPSPESLQRLEHEYALRAEDRPSRTASSSPSSRRRPTVWVATRCYCTWITPFMPSARCGVQ